MEAHGNLERNVDTSAEHASGRVDRGRRERRGVVAQAQKVNQVQAESTVTSFSQSNFESGCFQAGVKLAPPPPTKGAGVASKTSEARTTDEEDDIASVAVAAAVTWKMTWTASVEGAHASVPAVMTSRTEPRPTVVDDVSLSFLCET